MNEEAMEQVEYKIHQPLIQYLNDKISLFKATNQILSISIKGKTIKELIEGWSSCNLLEKDPALSLPNDRRALFSSPAENAAYLCGQGDKQQDMLNNNFVKVLKEE